MLFTSYNQFELYGEQLGLVLKADTLTGFGTCQPRHRQALFHPAAGRIRRRLGGQKLRTLQYFFGAAAGVDFARRAAHAR